MIQLCLFSQQKHQLGGVLRHRLGSRRVSRSVFRYTSSAGSSACSSSHFRRLLRIGSVSPLSKLQPDADYALSCCVRRHIPGARLLCVPELGNGDADRRRWNSIHGDVSRPCFQARALCPALYSRVPIAVFCGLLVGLADSTITTARTVVCQIAVPHRRPQAFSLSRLVQVTIFLKYSIMRYAETISHRACCLHLM